MFTRLATAALAITLLGASAYALSPLHPAASEQQPSAATTTTTTITIIEKNSVWPLKDRISMDPCTISICQEA